MTAPNGTTPGVSTPVPNTTGTDAPPREANVGEELHAPLQDEETRTKVLQNSTAGAMTAVGRARDFHLGDQEDRTDKLPGGSEIPIAGGDSIKSDFAQHEVQEPTGAQAEPAIYTTNGTLPVNMVPSPSGLVPAGAVAGDPREALRRTQEALDAHADSVHRTGGYARLSRTQIETMGAGDLRSVASQRGYDLGEYAGSRATRRRFIAAQNDDDDLTGDRETDETEQ